MGQHKIIVHRGMSTLAPENTMAAFELMPRYNVNWLETDLAITSDEKLVIMHDGDVTRTTNGHGRVTALSFEELHSKRCKEGNHQCQRNRILVANFSPERMR